MKLPLFTSLGGYRSSWLRGDIVAGLTVWAILAPESLAYASIAGVSPVVGLYAAPAALVLYAAFGSSRQLIAGPVSATAALSAAAVADFATRGTDEFVALTVALAIATGIAALVAGLLRLGFLANFISEPVLKGFIIGLALTIIVGQLPRLFGVEGTSGGFFERLWDFLAELRDTSGLTLLVGLISLALVLGLRRIAPVVPGALAAVVFGILCARILGLGDHGVALVGDVDSGLPSFGLPDVAAQSYLDLAPAAVGVMLVAFAEGLAAAKAYAAKHHYEIDANRELVALGAANIGSGLSSGMVVGGSLSKTAVNDEAGGKSQLTALVAAGLTLVTLFFLTGLFEDLPETTLAAVVIAAVIDLVDIKGLVELYRLVTDRLARIYGVAARADFIAAVAALLGVLIFDTLPGLFIGIGVSMLLLVYRASRPHVATVGKVPGTAEQYGDVERNPENVQAPGIVVLRPESNLFFANADEIRKRIIGQAAEQGTRAIVLDCSTVPSIDVTAAHMLAGLADELEHNGVRLVLARDIGQVRDVIERAGSAGATHLYPSVEAAVADLQRSSADSGPDLAREPDTDS